MLFHVVNDRHRKKRAMIFTTNKPLSAWGRVLHDDDLAHAIVDRILERGRMLTLDGPSMRTKHPTRSAASHHPATSPDGEVIRISGIQVPEFPEPTWAADSRGSQSHGPQIHADLNLTGRGFTRISISRAADSRGYAQFSTRRGWPRIRFHGTRILADTLNRTRRGSTRISHSPETRYTRIERLRSRLRERGFRVRSTSHQVH